jgi:non-specific serine/threonine protein kinase
VRPPGTRRLVTLTGAGGCGKTRLALQVARAVLDHYPDGAWLVELAPLSDPGLVPRAVASVLGVSESPDRPLVTALAEFLGTKSLLLILDNCEHLVAACAELAEALLRHCPNLRILATSREVLAAAGEATWRVPSLQAPSVESAAAPGAMAGLRPGPRAPQLLEFEAIRLFVERAAAMGAGFGVTEENALAVAEVCRRLDGIPLAIELAAARVKVFAVEQIAAGLDDCLRLLASGQRTAVPRQQTLRATVDWSYGLLSEPERALLRRLAVFAGGWTFEAAEAVCVGEGIAAHAVLDLLAMLVDKSLVQAEERQGTVRYRLLETIRQYAREKLEEAGEAERTQDRHLAYFLDLAEEGDPKLRGPEQRVWLDRLDVEHDNLRAALHWSLTAGAGESALRLCGALSGTGGAAAPTWRGAAGWRGRSSRRLTPRRRACARSTVRGGSPTTSMT